ASLDSSVHSRYLQNLPAKGDSKQAGWAIYGSVSRKNCGLPDAATTIWLFVPTLTGTFVNVTQLLPGSEVADASRYGLFVNGQVKTSRFEPEEPRLRCG